MRSYTNFEFMDPLIGVKPAKDLEIIAVTPAYYEKDIFSTLNSFYSAERLSVGSIEIIVVINESEEVDPEVSDFHKNQFKELQEWAERNNEDNFRILPVYVRSLPVKHAGVGLARKIGMDEAVRRFQFLEKPHGIIACPDADVTVAENYFGALKKYFLSNPLKQAASIYFEHDLEKAAENGLQPQIIEYECHLRYMVEMQRLLGLPYAFQTVGSAMAVTAKGYLAHFGMNKRQAGEDFYFLQKFINAGFLGEINNTTVFPAARYSDRVPFGTGSMMHNMVNAPLMTYHPATFDSLRPLTDNLKIFYLDPWLASSLPEKPVLDFFGEKLIPELLSIQKTTRDYEAFRKRFYRWFDAFQLIKYLHHSRDHYFENIPVAEACDHLFKRHNLASAVELHEKLLILRKRARVGY